MLCETLLQEGLNIFILKIMVCLSTGKKIMVYLTMKVTWATVRFCNITASLFSLMNHYMVLAFVLQMHNIFSFGQQMYDILTGKMYRHNTVT